MLLLLSVCLKIGDVLWNPANCLLQGCCLFLTKIFLFCIINISSTCYTFFTLSLPPLLSRFIFLPLSFLFLPFFLIFLFSSFSLSLSLLPGHLSDFILLFSVHSRMAVTSSSAADFGNEFCSRADFPGSQLASTQVLPVSLPQVWREISLTTRRSPLKSTLRKSTTCGTICALLS